jgi:hypothetical protein
MGAFFLNTHKQTGIIFQLFDEGKDFMPKTFQNGDRCRNDVGWYTVSQVVSKFKMLVKYDNGKIRALDVEEELPNRKGSASRPRPAVVLFKKLDGNYYKFLGFLAKNCFIDAHIKEVDRQRFANEYFDMTDVKLNIAATLEGFTVGAAAQWGVSMRVYFDTVVFDLITGLEQEKAKTEISNGKAAINSKEWTYELFNMGFRIARGHDIDKIKTSIPQEFQEAFAAGVVLAELQLV